MSATYTGAFELRRLLVKFNRAPGGGTSEDADIVSCHFAKLTGGAVDAAWVAADYTAVENAFDTVWATMKGNYGPLVILSEYRWFKDGPVWSPADLVDGPPNPAERVTTRNVPGTLAGQVLPPQIAWTVTKQVPIKKRWGRMYFPSPGPYGDSAGRLSTTQITSWLGLLVAWMNTCRAAGKQPVVWSRGRSAYVTRRGASIPDHPASAYEITSLQIDNLWDVQRSRRYTAPTVRSVTNLT